MAFNPSEFKANFLGDGSRANKFQISLNFPTIANSPIAGARLSFLAEATQLPGSSIGVSRLYYFGREIKLAGDRVFQDWSFNVINDEDFAIRNAFTSWMDAINSHSLNVRNPAAFNLIGYSIDAEVIQFSKIGTPIKTYKMIDAFPIDVSPIDVNWSAMDEIEKFTVTMALNQWSDDTTS